jgi:eukaryotic-like serine/threonine-protein kinase
MADLVGQQIGNYRLVRLLGQGGFAEVYLGEHVYLGTSAAIKILHAQLASEDVEHFQAESRTIARLAHPHIVRVLDFGVADATPYLVVDYAPNGTLRKRHPKSSLPSLATIVTYVTQISSALQYAHDQKVIHRDVKPENMLLGRDNEVLLSDFGIALVAQSTNYHSTQGIQELAGTISYMAPEQIQSRACTNSDQYSLGVVVYEWLSGTRPFQGSFAEIAVKHTLAPPPSLRGIVPTLSPAIEAVVMKALAKDPKERYENIRTFANALQHAYLQMPATTIHLGDTPASTRQPASAVETLQLSNEEENSPAALLTVPILTTALPTLTDTTAIPPSPALETPALAEAQPLSPTVRRGISRRSVLLGLIGAAAIGASGGGLAWLFHKQAAPGLLSPIPSSNVEGSTLYTFRGHSSWVWAAAWSPDSSRIASASGDGTAQVWDALSGDHLNIYYGHSDSVYTVAWSPDGRRIASAGYDKSVQVWDATYGDHFFSYLGHAALVWSVAWSPDGRRIASAGGDKTVQVWDATNGSPQVTYRGHTGFVYRIAWSPGSKYIASASDDGTVQVWNATDGHLLYTFQSISASVLAVAWSPQGQRIASAGSDGQVQVWDAMSGNHLYIYYGHTDFVYALSWSPDGGRIASGGDDKTVQLWNAQDGSDVYTYHGHTNSVRSVAWANNGKQITSASFDKTVQVWRA